jgi:hypothetical protein
MEALYDSLLQLFMAGWDVLVTLAAVLLPWTALAAWIVFWLFGVNWVKLRSVLLEGGAIGLVLIGLVMILVWATVAPPAEGSHFILGLTLSNFVGKAVYVTALFCILLLCGSVQLSGVLGDWGHFEEPVEAPAHAHSHGNDHGHGNSHH